MTQIADVLKSAIALGLQPLLKGEGFRKNSTQFYRRTEDALEVLHVQSSQWNTADSGRFTINLGVHFPAVARCLKGEDPMPDPPQEAYCVLRERIGLLLPGHNDYWWTITPATVPAELAKTLSDVCQEYALPWLTKHRDLRTAAGELQRKQDYWTAAAASLVLGDASEAGRLAGEQLAWFRSHPIHPHQPQLSADAIARLEAWAKAKNLPL
jgi:uncharacterized protein DUF4304